MRLGLVFNAEARRTQNGERTKSIPPGQRMGCSAAGEVGDRKVAAPGRLPVHPAPNITLACSIPQEDRQRKVAQSVKRRQLVMVLAMSMAMVMGPTPPGTGVMARHFGATSSKATSPVSR